MPISARLRSDPISWAASRTEAAGRRPGISGCARYVPPDATDYDTSAYSCAAMNDEAAGSGSGKPGATDPPDNHPSEDALLQVIWAAP